MPTSLARLSLLLLAAAACGAKDGFPNGFDMKDAERRHQDIMRQHHEEMKHLNKIHKDHEDFECTWTEHKDVDDSIYFFSRMLKRSEREPPASWTKDAKGKWKPPKRCNRKEEL